MRQRAVRAFQLRAAHSTKHTRTSKLTDQKTVPGSSQRFLDKSRSLTADCVTYDLEDSVTPHMKAEARTLVRRAIDQPAPEGIRERAVRINSVDSGLALGDLTEVVSLCRRCTRRKNSIQDKTDQSAAPPSSNHTT